MSVVLMDEYRKKAPRAQCPDHPRYHCMTCECDRFKLYGNGSVHCASCGSLIKNVEVFGR